MNKYIILFFFMVLYQVCTCQPNNIVFYPFNGNANDISPNNLHGTVSGATLTTDRCGNLNSAYYFDGVNDVITIPDNNTLDIGNQDYSLVAWIKTSSNNFGRIISKGSSSCQTGYMMRTGGSSATKIHLENAYQSNCKVALVGTTLINDNQWHCIVGVVKRDSFAKIFIDGIFDNQQTINTSNFNLSNNLALLIGANYQNAIFPEWFHGTIDDVKIFNKYLTIDEVNNACFDLYEIVDSISICNGDNYQGYGVSGVYYDTINCNTVHKIILTVLPNWIASSTSGTIACNGGTTTVNAIITGGIAPYTYTWSNGATAQNLINVPAGTYILTVTDANGCTITDTSIVTQPSQFTATITGTNILCNGTGSATATASGGTSPYTFTWNTNPAQYTATAANLAAGTYTVTVKDVNNCSTTANVTITQPTPLVANINTQTNLAGQNLIVNPSAELPPTTFGWTQVSGNWQQRSTSPSPQHLANYFFAGASANAQLYQDVDVSNNAVNIDNGIAKYYFQCYLRSFAQTPTDESKVILEFQNAAGFPLFTYDTGFSSQTNNWIPFIDSVLAPPLTRNIRVKLIAVRNNGSNNDGYIDNLMLTTTPGYIASPSNATCSGGNASVYVSGGTLPYTYTWNTNPPQYTATATNLSAGTYTVTVKDANNCTSTASVTITQPTQLVASSTAGTILCNGGSTTVTVSATGGTAPYTGTGTFTVNQGNYSYTVTDANGCTSTTTGTISQPNQLVASSTAGTILCNGASTTVTVTATGGTAPYTGTGTFTVNAGNYSYTVTDANGCTSTTTGTITQPATLVAGLTAGTILCNGGITTITVTATGGTAPYTGTGTFIVSAGNYSYTVTDANGCTSITTGTITQPTTLVASSTHGTILCNGGTTTVTVTATGGTAPYTGTGTFTVNQGNYSYTVTDANGCTSTTTGIITQPTPLAASSTAGTILCNGGSTTVNVTATGGTAPYTGTGTFTVNAGNYSYTVTDANGCTATASISISQPSPISISISTQQNVSCFGGTNGNVSVNATGGTGNLTFSWSNGQIGNTISNLDTGVYTVFVTDTHNCQAQLPITITQSPDIIIDSVAIQQASCNGANNGSIVVNASGGTSTFTYSWSNGQTGNSLNNLSIGTYTVFVTDTNNCVKSQSYTITQPNPITINSLNTTNVSCFGGTNGTATAFATGGTGVLNYSWSNGQTGTNANNLSAGNYTLFVTDANACTTSQSFTILQPTPIQIDSIIIDSVNCANTNTGGAIVAASGGTGTLFYTWSNGQIGQNLSNVLAGNYTVSISDSNNCQISQTISVLAPLPLQVSATVLATACNNTATGMAQINATGGVGTYTYSWNNGQTTQIADSLASGNYPFTVTDANGCASNGSVNIVPFTIQLTQTNVACFGGNNGITSVFPTGGLGNYSYSWNNGATTATINGLQAGTYIVSVQDITSCIITDTINITEPNQLLAATNLIQMVNCFGNSTGSANVMVNGGTSPYTFTWNTSPTQYSATASNLATGTYTVIVTDANACTTSSSIFIPENPAIQTTAQVGQNVSCFGGNNGIANVQVIGGAGGYTYTWNTSPAQYGNIANNLTAGTYIVTIADSLNCLAFDSIYITEPQAISISFNPTNIPCFGENTGSIVSNVTGGVSPYTYTWNTGQTSANLNNLPAGAYTLTVTDANLCTKTATIILTQPLLIQSTVNETNVKCFGGNDGNAFVAVSGGVPSYTYSWNNGQTSNPATNLAAGTYFVQITDANGCIHLDTAYITQPTMLNITAKQDTSVTLCYGASNGKAITTVSGGTAPYTYSWDNGETTASAQQLNVGYHIVWLTDANGCRDSARFSMQQSPKIEIEQVEIDSAYCNLANGNAKVIASGGNGDFSYTWNSAPAQYSPIMQNVVGGTYTVFAIDKKGCVDSLAVEIPNIPPPVAYFTSNPDNSQKILAEDLIRFLNLSVGAYTIAVKLKNITFVSCKQKQRS